MQHTPAIRDLQERPDWLRDLAYSLVSDAATADDLIQEAWMSALQSPTVEIKDPKARDSQSTQTPLGRS
jgi:DNA-directed RNA polymerase specialized sigma24 family protein